MKMFAKIACYTIADRMKPKSIYLFLFVSIGLLITTRGCYSADYVINGRHVESIWHVSRIVFQAISMAMLLMATMISMRIFTRDQNDGSVQMFLSRPVRRWEYALGRIFGTWLLTTAFMFILHLTVLVIIWLHTDKMPLGYIGASLICSVNLLFVICAVCLFSIFLPDFISAFFTLGLLCAGYVSDGGYKLLNTETITAFAAQPVDITLSTWRVLYPKLFMVQAYADSLITDTEFVTIGAIHPLINVGFFIVFLLALTVFVFNKKSI
jgi:ABC-type transport system involved in multi-copper enzyme maturation permease subunit